MIAVASVGCHSLSCNHLSIETTKKKGWGEGVVVNGWGDGGWRRQGEPKKKEKIERDISNCLVGGMFLKTLQSRFLCHTD